MATINVVTNEIDKRQQLSGSGKSKRKVLPDQSSEAHLIAHQKSVPGTAMLSDLEDIRNKEREALANNASASVRCCSAIARGRNAFATNNLRYCRSPPPPHT